MKIKGELSLDEAKSLVQRERIVYVVVDQNETIVKIFDYHREASQFATAQGLKSYNITHPKCPRSVKFELGNLYQYDMFLDQRNEVLK